MFRTQFPDLQWLKQQIKQGFPQQAQRGWPHVILQVKTSYAIRENIQGPLSIFSNLSGQSYCRTEGRERVMLDEDHYFLSNQQELYSLEINSEKPVETFNIHLGDAFVNRLFHDYSHSSASLLDQEQEPEPLLLFSRLYRKEPALLATIQKLRDYGPILNEQPLLMEELLASFTEVLLRQHKNLQQQIQNLGPCQAATKREIYRRLSLAHDYMHTHYAENPGLDVLARVACLSKFHFLRLFKSFYHKSPHQYMLQLRLQKARELLKNPQIPVQEVASQLGFENLSSFSRLFRQKEQCSPLFFRHAAV